MKFLIIAALVSVAAAVPYAEHAPAIIPAPTLITKQMQTIYAPITQSKYGSQVNHLVPVPAPIVQGVPQPYAVPVPQPYAVPRPVPVAVPRAVPVAVPRAVPVPLVAQAAPIVTSSVAYDASPAVVSAPALSYGGLAHGSLYGGFGYGKGHY
ncbi:hypothetical protein SSS_08412 [Sarcoptes scabiei]|uniref:Uncharacterized protein n=1 Tax=Sarcoptes scabiei TaxID=52283 RepID=A0A834RH00_SARSC|nr:hypothetical protein SSS_08412 [Sarcoptes scabiei]UXI19687.1 hypothetical protein NH340_JMT05630 [Sarcoptes scabiei]